MSVPEALIRKRRVSAPVYSPALAPALKILPPDAPRPGEVAAESAIAVPAPLPKRIPPIVPRLDDAVAQPAIAVPAVRPRYAEGEPDRLTKLSETMTALRQPIQ